MIIIQCHAFVSEVERRAIHANLVEQARDGILVLPACCTLRAVTSQDTEDIIIVKEGEKKCR